MCWFIIIRLGTNPCQTMVGVSLFRVPSSASIVWSSSFFSSSAQPPIFDLHGLVSSKIINQDSEASSEVRQLSEIGWVLSCLYSVLGWQYSIWLADCLYSIIIYENSWHQSQLISRHFRFPTCAKHSSGYSPEQVAIQPLLRLDPSSRRVVR